jgi:hypothetical protein
MISTRVKPLEELRMFFIVAIIYYKKCSIEQVSTKLQIVGIGKLEIRRLLPISAY